MNQLKLKIKFTNGSMCQGGNMNIGKFSVGHIVKLNSDTIDDLSHPVSMMFKECGYYINYSRLSKSYLNGEFEIVLKFKQDNEWLYAIKSYNYVDLHVKDKYQFSKFFSFKENQLIAVNNVCLWKSIIRR